MNVDTPYPQIVNYSYLLIEIQNILVSPKCLIFSTH